MPSVGRTIRHVPYARLLVAAEVLLLARRHMVKLEAHEWRRLLELVRHTRGRRRNLTEQERLELSRLVLKAEPRQFVNSAMKKVVGVPLPGSGRRERASAKHD
jgi:hypothetical protein